MTARTPEQDAARRTAEEEPVDSREVRRRLTFGVAGDLADMPATLSPWQRAYEAWRAAGLSWGHGAPPRERAPEAAGMNAVRVPAPPVEPEDVPKAEPAPEPAVTPETRPEPYDVLVAGPPKPRPQAVMRSGLSRRLRARAAVAAGLVVVAGGVIVGVSRGGDETNPGIPGPVAAGALFAADPAATTDGLVQDLTTVASAGGTVVAAGTEGDGVPGRERARFLVSDDAGHSWSLAKLRTPDGSVLPSGDTPGLVAGADGGWVALGRSSGGGVAAWTSGDARTWTRRPPAKGFTPSDRVNDLTRTARGFVAVGSAGGHAATWSSADGRAWQRIDGIAGIIAFDRVAASGDVVLAHGTYPKKAVKKKGGKKVRRTVRADGLWRSADGGRTWAPAPVPQAQGSYGPTKGLAVGPGGFVTVREGRKVSGRKKHRKTKHFGVLLTSADGRKWQVASRFDGFGIERFDGTPSGLAVIVRGAKGTHTVLRSADGRSWQAGGTIAAPVRTSGLTVANGQLAVSGQQGDDAYLLGVDLRTVPGAVHPERSIRSLAAGPGLSVAVGSTNGGVAIWTAPDGRAWERAQFPGTGGRLSDVVHGNHGWLAVGRVSGRSPGPLVLSSQDGLAWQRAVFPAGPPPVAVTTGPAGYVAIGTGVAWRSADLRTWRHTKIDGAPADVTAVAGNYVAVGGRGKAPAAWTSPDGLKWAPVKLPPGLTAPLTQVVAKGGTLVAIAAGSAALVSTDAGTTWTRRDLGPGLTATAVTPTPRGFVVAAASNGDAAVLTSRDGTAWRRLDVAGLTGPGDQRLTTLTTTGTTVLATGTDAETPTLWRAPVPKQAR